MTEQFNPNRKTFFNISSFQVMIMFRRGLFYSYLSIYLRFFLGLSVTETTFFATFPMIINVLFQAFVWGNLSDKLQLRRTLIIIGEVLAGLITFLIWYIHILPDSKLMAGYVLIIGMTVVEIFWSMSNVAWSALLSDLYPEKERTGLQGRMASVGAVGRFIGILVGGFLYDGMGKSFEGWGFYGGALFFIAGGVMIISTIPMFFVPEGGIKKGDSGALNIAALTSAPKSRMSKKYMVFLLAMVLINFGINSIILLKSQYLILDDGFDVSSQLLSYILSMATIAIFFIGLFIKPVSRKISDEALLLGGSATAILYLLGYALSINLPVIFVSDFLAGAAMVILQASSYSYASRLIPPEKRGRQFALFNAALFLSWGLPGTLITGPLIDWLINIGTADVVAYKMAFYVATFMVATGGVVLIFCFKMKKEYSGNNTA
jgi:MFS family permease